MKEQFLRSAAIYGENGIKILNNAHVAVFGVGGVGGYVVEALARIGVGKIDLIDNDTVCESNLNRQIIALYSNIGQYKVDVAAKRVRDINPDCIVTAHRCFYLPENSNKFDFSQYDYIVDAVDTVAAKTEIICRAATCETPVISAMGAGNKTDPCGFRVADIYSTKGCPLARVMRSVLKKSGIKKLKTVYSPELPVFQKDNPATKNITGSLPHVVAVAGFIIASEVINDILKKGIENAKTT